MKNTKRYFAGQQPGESRSLRSSDAAEAKKATSSMPVEDEATGFLAFGDEEESEQEVAADDEEEAAEDEGESGNSSDEDAEEDGAEAEADVEVEAESSVQTRKVSASKKGKAKQNGKAKARKQADIATSEADSPETDDEDMQGAQDVATALTREDLLDAVPYSRFEAIVEGETANVVIKENKRKRGRESLYFGLRLNEALTFLGIGHVQVLRGVAQIGGAVISASTNGLQFANVYAPLCNALPVLKAVSAMQFPGHEDEKTSTSSASAQNDDPDVAALLAQDFDTIVKVTPLSSPITALGQVCPIGGLATPFSLPSNLELADVYQLSTIKVLLAPDTDKYAQKHKNVAANGTFTTAGLTATYIPHTWQKSLHRLALSALSAAEHPQEEAVVALVRGNKKVGKSTLSRMALERLLSLGKKVGGKVAYLELDLGQSDFGPPGMVALHVFSLEDNAPPSTHKARMAKRLRKLSPQQRTVRLTFLQEPASSSVPAGASLVFQSGHTSLEMFRQEMTPRAT